MVHSPDPAARCWRCGSSRIRRHVCDGCGTVQPGGAPRPSEAVGRLETPRAATGRHLAGVPAVSQGPTGSQACRTPGCLREPRPEFAHCPTHTSALLSRAMAGQALLEFALILPVLVAIFLGAAEMGMLYAARAGQDRATGVVADWSAAHPSGDWAAIAVIELPGCTVTRSEAVDVLTIDATCLYRPRITSNLWNGLPVGSSESAALEPSPTPTPSPSPEPSESIAP